MATAIQEDIEFWRLPTVIAKVGLSKTEIYRRISKGSFPKARPYPGSPGKRFWVSTEVRAWQQAILDQQFAELFG